MHAIKDFLFAAVVERWLVFYPAIAIAITSEDFQAHHFVRQISALQRTS